MKVVRIWRLMTRLWPWVAFVGFLLLAAIAAVILIHYASDIPDPLILSVLISFGVIAAALLLLFITARYIVKPNLYDTMSQVAEALVSFLNSVLPKYQKSGESVNRIKNILHQLRPVISIISGFLALNGIVLLLIGLSNASVMYLQVKRLDVQNNLLEFQTAIAKHQVVSDVAHSLGESYRIIEIANRNTTSLIDYHLRILEIGDHIRRTTAPIDRFYIARISGPDGFFEDSDKLVPKCSADLPGCHTIDSIDDSVVDDLPFIDSVEELRRLYLVSVFIESVYEELDGAVKTHLNVDSGLVAKVGQKTDRIGLLLHEAIRVCGLLHHSQLTAHDNYHMLGVVDRMKEVSTYANLIKRSWDGDSIPKEDRIVIINGLKDSLRKTTDRLSEARHSAGPGSTFLWEELLIIFGRGMRFLRFSMEDLGDQCLERLRGNQAVIDLLEEHAARSYMFVKYLRRSDVAADPITRIPLDFYEVPLLDLYGATFAQLGSHSVSVPPGLRVDPDHVSPEGVE